MKLRLFQIVGLHCNQDTGLEFPGEGLYGGHEEYHDGIIWRIVAVFAILIWIFQKSYVEMIVKTKSV